MKWKKFDKYTFLTKEYESYLRELTDYVSQSPYRPLHHICPPCGLLNDPNGLCYYNGYYHVFYQWYPFEAEHGMKHWAHVKSKDLISYEWCEEMLIPDQEYEKNGCYSGNSIEKDGKLYLFYTANYKTEAGKIPKQAVAIMEPNGSIHKYEGNPIIDGAPAGMKGEIRDPYVFEENGCFYMLLGASSSQDQGQLLLYKSRDLLHWDYEGTIDISLPSCGTMIECPAYMKIDGRDVLFLSLIGLEPEGDRYQNQFTTLYLVGDLDLSNRNFSISHYDELECGFDFYAPQSFHGKNGEPLLFGWFGCGDQKLPTDIYGWRHALTLPRELSIRNDRLFMKIPKEIEEQFGQRICLTADRTSLVSLPRVCCAEVLVPFNLGAYTLRVGEEDDYWEIRLDEAHRRLTFDRSNLKISIDQAYGTRRSCSLNGTGDISLLIFSDNSFLEIFVNNGERVLSGRVFLPNT